MLTGFKADICLEQKTMQVGAQAFSGGNGPSLKDAIHRSASLHGYFMGAISGDSFKTLLYHTR